MEPQQLGNALQWLGTGAIGLLSLIGIGKLVELLFVRFFKKKDKLETLHETNNANQLNADADLRGDLIERVGILEARLDEVQDALTHQMVENATLKAENAGLQKDNERQEAEIAELRKFRREDAILIAELRAELNALKLIVSNYHTGLAADGDDPLKIRMVDAEGNDK